MLFMAVLSFSQSNAETLSCFSENIVSIKTEAIVLASLIVALAAIKLVTLAKKKVSDCFLFISFFLMFISSVSGALIALDLREKVFFFWLTHFLLINAFISLVFSIKMFNFPKRDYIVIDKKELRQKISSSVTILLLFIELMAIYITIAW